MSANATCYMEPARLSKSSFWAFCLPGGESFFIAITTSHKAVLRLISATQCLYLIIGLLWGAIYTLLETVVPGGFSGGTLEQANSSSHLLQSFTYFSFITLTTLGYGDITPQPMGAGGGLCQAEAIVGQFYPPLVLFSLVVIYTIFIGSLVIGT